jgi:nitroimidazol reductase NimA-like FMN-containing flavoprotein (pyridoxamine 5'-phosphate oxidase superfamily)
MNDLATRNPLIRDLTEDEAWAELRRAPYGRLAVTAIDQADIFPINFVVDDRVIYFRTAPGSKLLELTVNPRVALEVDEFTAEECRSVVVHGVAEELERQDEIDAADLLNLRAWFPTLKYRWVRVVPGFVRGISFQRTGEPERY